MRQGTVGFMFSIDRQHVALIEKLRPASQAGFLNGIGGKCEEGEHSQATMVREFEEETGVQTSTSDWSPFAYVQDFAGWQFVCFRAFSGKIWSIKKTEEEAPIILTVKDAQVDHRLMPNLRWMIPMALDPQILPVSCVQINSEVF